MGCDVIVVGAGHAGIEAALAAARMNMKTLVLTLNLDSVGFLACNPNIGGTSKAQLVREADALDGMIGVVADRAALQMRMLNSSKGAAVQSLRCQVDKSKYHTEMKKVLENASGLLLKQEEVTGLLIKDGRIEGVATALGTEYRAKAVILATGVYLDSRVIIGDYTKKSGPSGFFGADRLTESLIVNGIEVRRFKTGTPMRIDRRSVDFTKLEIQEGDTGIPGFSFIGGDCRLPERQEPCWLTYTNEKTHKIIRKNIHRSPLYNGVISGVGPRYCPSVEDKVMRFADKERHQVFLEPEGADTNEMYVQGMSSSMPHEVQQMMLRSLHGLENAEITRYAYAIEYDCIDPLQLDSSLKVKAIEGLYTAGQINGSSGYEEAAAQGLVAGVNAALYIKGKAPFILSRDSSYIGVLIDDLVTKGTNEPYRMMTSRAEYRLHLRQDNADTRLTPLGYAVGCVSEERYRAYLDKRRQAGEINEILLAVLSPAECAPLFAAKGLSVPETGVSLRDLLKRPEFGINELIEWPATGGRWPVGGNNPPQRRGSPISTTPPPFGSHSSVEENCLSELALLAKGDTNTCKISEGIDNIAASTPCPLSLFRSDALLEVQSEIKYEGYLRKQEREISEKNRYENIPLDKNTDYLSISGLRLEARQKLTKVLPLTIGQAARIPGVSPADINVLIVAMKLRH